MNDDELELLDRYLNGTIDEQHIAQLDELLRRDADARRRLRDLATVDCMLQELAAGDEAGWGAAPQPQTQTPPGERTQRGAAGVNRVRWFSALSVLIGLLLGVVSTSIVWAVGLPRSIVAPSSATRQVTMFDESFENPELTWHAGFPSRAEQWSGDEAVVVAAETDEPPRDGEYVLKMQPSSSDLFSHAHYIIDLEKQPAVHGEPGPIEVAASFLPAEYGKRSRYVLRAAAFALEPEEIDPQWMKQLWREMDEHALAHAARGVTIGPDVPGWQEFTLTLDAPPGTRYIVVSFWAATMDRDKAAHYLDDVHVARILETPSAETTSP